MIKRTHTHHSVENGGPLKVEHVWYVEGQGNLIIEYTPEGAKGEFEGGGGGRDKEKEWGMLLLGTSSICSLRDSGICWESLGRGSSQPGDVGEEPI